jgi:hypothetical protein
MLRLWGVTVPIYRLLQKEAFQPEDVALVSNVFEDLLQTLDLVDRREDPVATLVAQKVIELAQTGVRDPIRLKKLTLEAFGLPD